jgi:hypothetical protein
MKNFYLLLVASIAFYNVSKAQQIVSVAPGSGVPGTEIIVNIGVSGINLQQGNVQLDFGNGISVFSTQVVNPQILSARIIIAPNASEGFRDINLSVGANRYAAPAAFEVSKAGNFVLQLEVIPMQSLYVADLDPENVQNAPLLFRINVQNDQVQRNLTIKLHVSGAENGFLITAEKMINPAVPNGTYTFTNRDFDRYLPNKDKLDLFKKTLESGKLPADVYSYKLEAYDNSILLGSDEGINVVNNPVARPELISPGVLFGQVPEIINNKNPFLQWFSQSAQNEIAIFPVFPGQKTKEEIFLNRPVYKTSNFTGNSLVYPSAAEQLEEGKTYAWQVTGINPSSRGEQTFFSEVYWFTVAKLDEPVQLVQQLLIDPMDISTTTFTRTKITAKALDKNGMLADVSSQVQWRVIPSDFGTISNDGTFITNGKTGTCAILATYEKEQVYTTVNIRFVPSSGGWNMQLLLKELFGAN